MDRDILRFVKGDKIGEIKPFLDSKSSKEVCMCNSAHTVSLVRSNSTTLLYCYIITIAYLYFTHNSILCLITSC